MTEADWNPTEEAPPPRKRRFPRWAIFGCGGCAAVLLVVTVAGVILGGRWLKEVQDPEVQWPRLREVLPYDERPQDLVLQAGSTMGVGYQFVFVDREESLTIYVQDFDVGEEEFQEILASEMVGQPRDPVRDDMELQGRTVPIYSYEEVNVPKLFGEEAQGAGLRVDISAGDRQALVDLRRVGSREPVTEEQARAFLDHFDVWRGR